MRLTAMVALAAVIGTTAQAGQKGNQVTVYLSDNASVPPLVKIQAQGLAVKMFAEIGVRIDWRLGTPPASTMALGIELATDTPSELLPGALAYALPYEGVHIRVFWDRIEGTEDRSVRIFLLAHVLVHEITHVLQGSNRHSDTGVMKAHWSKGDLVFMRFKPLPFTKEDVALIQQGLAARNAGSLAMLAANHTPVAVEVFPK